MNEARARQTWLQMRMKTIHFTVGSAKKINSEFSKKDRAEFEYRQREYKEEIYKAAEMRKEYLN